MRRFTKRMSKQKNALFMAVLIFVFVTPFPLLYLKDRIYSLKASEDAFLPKMTEDDYIDADVRTMERVIRFSDGGVYTINRFLFDDDLEDGRLYTKTLALSGSDIEIRWQNYDKTPAKLELLEDITKPPKATLFIETDEESMVLSIPALYYNRFEHKTIEALTDLERACIIERKNGGYEIRLSFERVNDTVGEVWYYRTKEPLSDWLGDVVKIITLQDLHKTRRFSYDGYYFKTYTTYKPYTENGFFRNPANFSGAQILKCPYLGKLQDIGYAMTKICAQNQNEYGFWETGPLSEWLYADYGIEYDFYDTRFSTDFARSLLTGYDMYKDKEFISRAVTYAGFLLELAEREGYKLTDGAVLVPDYWGEPMMKKPHVSLNHQLAELNFLFELFIITNVDEYYNAAKSMLKGIEQTEKDWIMADGNLEYAILYEQSVNVMKDYPYLTYNDLYETKGLLYRLGEESKAIERLMETKKAWMDKNGVTGYLGYTKSSQGEE